MARVQGYTEDEVDVLVADFERVVQHALDEACAATAARLRPAQVLASALVAASPSAHIGPEDAAVVTQVWQEQVDGVLVPYVAELHTGSAVSVAIGIGDAFPDAVLPGVPLVPDAYATTYLQTVTNRLVGVGDELWEDVRNELLDGVAAGQSIPQLAARVRAVSGFDETRATRIARTEVHAAAEAGSFAQVKYVGYTDAEATKEWVATHDLRTRLTHSLADGQRVALGEKFNVGGSLLDFPGDPSGAADEIINCRCTTVFDLDEAPRYRCDGALTSAVTPADGSVCVIPLGPASIDHVTDHERFILHDLFMGAQKISPAWGGAKIFKILQAVRKKWEKDPVYGPVIAKVDDRQFLAAVDAVYGKKGKKTFLQVFDEWSATPNGKKAIGPVAPTPTHGLAPVDKAPTVTPSILSPPTGKFRLLDDPGPSGDGNFGGNGPWGLYGSSGVLVRAVDENGVARFLLIQRGDKYIGSQKYKWQLPGGGLDAYESPYEAAAREMFEETAATKEYVESMIPLGEMVYTHESGWTYTSIVAHASHTFKPKVHGSTGDAKWFTLEEIQQMLDDGDIIKELSPTLRQLADELDDLAKDPAKVVHAPRVLPPVKPAPDPLQIQFTGQTLGSHGAQVWVDPATGDRWLFKPQEQFLIDLDVAMARLQSKAALTRPAVYEITLNGKKGSIQYMFEDSKPAFPGGSFDPTKLSPEDLMVFQMEQIFDWLISNHDTHSGQWIRLADGRLYGVDKGQAFKFFGKDKLDWTYVPVYPLGSDKLTYSAIWKRFIEGKIDLQDPTQGEIGEYLKRLMAIPDGTLRAIVAPYVKAVTTKFGGSKSKMMAAIVARKNALLKDFEEFYARALAERDKKLPPAPPKPPPPAVSTATPVPPPTTPVVTPPTTVVTGDLGDIVGIDETTLKFVWKKWLQLAGGKKVTPAWGGAKVYKILQDVHKFFKDAPDWPTLTQLQILRILDEQGGFVGKPKTFEKVVFDWIDNPASTKTILQYGLLDESLKKAAPPPIVPAVKPVVSPSATVLAEPTDAFDWGEVFNEPDLFDVAKTFKDNSVVAYAQVKSGDILRAVKKTNPDGDTILSVEIYKDGKWQFDEVFTDPQKMFDEYDFDTPTPWYKVAPESAHSSTSSTSTIVPGKLVGDVVTPDEIWASRYLWNDGDVVAETLDQKGSGFTLRLVSNGEGGLRVEYRISPTAPWTIGAHIDPEATPTLPSKYFGFTWKLGPDALRTKPTSPIDGKNAGDVVTADEIWHGTTTAKPGDVVAYREPSVFGAEYRLRFAKDTGYLTVESRTIGSRGPWAPLVPAHSVKDLKDAMGHFTTWRAAKIDGSPPDEILALLPGGKTPKGVKPATKIPTVYDGDPVLPSVAAAYESAFDDYEIIMTGVSGGGAWEWRIYKIEGYFIREERYAIGGGGNWEFNKIITSLQDPGKGTIFSGPKHWFASSSKVSSSSASAQAAKKAVTTKQKAAAKKAGLPSPAKKVAAPAAPPKPKKLTGDETHVPGKKVGDEVTTTEIMAHYTEYEDGTIVAVTKPTWGATRVVYVDGKLVLQEKTAAGAWKNHKIITANWQLYGKWYASTEKLGKPQHNAAKKFVAKKTGGVAPKPKPSYSSGVSSSPTPVAPFEMRDVDITPWDDAEQLEIYQFYRGMHVYTSATPEQMWNALQATKSHFQAKYAGKYTKLNEIEILRILDGQRAKTKGQTNQHWYESKIVNWLKTPQGKFYVNRRIDSPILAREIPAPMHALDNPAVDPDKETYKEISTSEALKARQDSHARYGPFTSSQKSAQRTYTGGSYTSWNAAIRKGDLGSYRSSIIASQQGMRPSTRPMLLRRGCSFAELNDPSITSYETLLPYVGRTYTTRGFTSTSVGGRAAFSGNLLIEFECPTGTPMSYVADFSHFPSERETTLPTHLVYKIISVKKNSDGKTVMRVRVIGVAT